MNNSNFSAIDPNISSPNDFNELHGLFRNPTDLDEISLPAPSLGNENYEDEISSIIQPLLPPQIDFDKISQSTNLAQHNDTHFFNRIYFNPSFSNVILLISLGLFMVWVIVLNCLTIVGLWKTHKKGHVVDLYLVNLAFGDVLLGILILPLISVVILLGYFPFSSFLCDAWVFLDYYLIVASSYGFTALMCNYLWMIRWPQTFPMDFKHHILALVLTWTAVNVSWTPPFFNDRLTVFYPTGSCGFSISRNQYFSFYIGLSGFYLPLAISLICGIWSLAVLKRHSGLPLFGFGKVEVTSRRSKEGSRSMSKNVTTRHTGNTNNIHGQGPSSIPNSSLHGIQRLLSHRHYSYNTRGQTHRIFKTAKAHYPLVVACFLLFIFTRCMFYTYFGVGSFVHHWFPTDISNGVYWLMHSNAAISPLFHFWFDPELRKSITILLGIKSSIPESSGSSKGSRSAVSPIINRTYNPERSRTSRTLDESGVLPSISISMGHSHHHRPIQSHSEDSYEHFLYDKNRQRKEDLAEVLLERSPPEYEGRSGFRL